MACTAFATSVELAAYLQTLPQELFDRIQDLVFTAEPGVRKIDKQHKPPAQLQCSRRTRKQFAETYYGGDSAFHFEGLLEGLPDWCLDCAAKSKDALTIFCPSMVAFGKWLATLTNEHRALISVITCKVKSDCQRCTTDYETCNTVPAQIEVIRALFFGARSLSILDKAREIKVLIGDSDWDIEIGWTIDEFCEVVYAALDLAMPWARDQLVRAFEHTRDTGEWMSEEIVRPQLRKPEEASRWVWSEQMSAT